MSLSDSSGLGSLRISFSKVTPNLLSSFSEKVNVPVSEPFQACHKDQVYTSDVIKRVKPRIFQRIRYHSVCGSCATGWYKVNAESILSCVLPPHATCLSFHFPSPFSYLCFLVSFFFFTSSSMPQASQCTSLPCLPMFPVPFSTAQSDRPSPPTCSANRLACGG